MTIFQVIVISIIEGLTEFIPVSSTGHIVLASQLIGVEPSVFSGSFAIAIQLGAILAVLVLYMRTLVQSPRTFWLLLIAFLPTAIIGVTIYPLVKVWLTEPAIVGYSLVIGGVILLIFEKWYTERPDDTQTIDAITWQQAIVVGLCQAVAMIPGVSRSGATIVGGMLNRLSRKAIVEFSFLLAIPTMAAATLYDLSHTAGDFTGGDWQLLAVGFGVSFLVSVGAIKTFLSFIQKYSFAVFGWYRIVVGVLVLWLMV